MRVRLASIHGWSSRPTIDVTRKWSVQLPRWRKATWAIVVWAALMIAWYVSGFGAGPQDCTGIQRTVGRSHTGVQGEFRPPALSAAAPKAAVVDSRRARTIGSIKSTPDHVSNEPDRSKENVQPGCCNCRPVHWHAPFALLPSATIVPFDPPHEGRGGGLD